MLHVLLRWLVLLVELHLLHFLNEFRLLLILSRLLLHGDLRATELLKHVLVVEDGVRELILELTALEELLNARCDLRHP